MIILGLLVVAMGIRYFTSHSAMKSMPLLTDSEETRSFNDNNFLH